MAILISSQYKVLEIQFLSVNYTLVARICKKFQSKQAVLVDVLKAKAVYNTFNSQ